MDYDSDNKAYDIHRDIQPISGVELYRKTLNITKHIAYSLPRNSNLNQIASLAKLSPLGVHETLDKSVEVFTTDNNDNDYNSSYMNIMNDNSNDAHDNNMSSVVYYNDGLCEIEQNCINGKVKMLTAYFGELISQSQ